MSATGGKRTQGANVSNGWKAAIGYKLSRTSSLLAPQANLGSITYEASALAMERPRSSSMDICDAFVAIAGPAAIFREYVRPPVPGHHVGPVLGFRVVDAIVHLPRAINVEAAAFRDLIEASTGDALLAINDVQASTLMIPGRQSTRALGANRV